MKKFQHSLIYFLPVITAIFLLSGCLGSGSNQYSSVVKFGFRVDAGQNTYNFDSTLVSGNDSLTIQQFRFVIGADSLVLNDSTYAIPQHKSKWQSVSVPAQQRLNPILLFPLGAIGTYSTFIFTVPKASNKAAKIDPDFTSNGHHYSMIIDGTYNGQNFTYKSDVPFSRSFFLGPIDLPKYNATYIVIVAADVTGWFSKNPGGSGGFYNPAMANDSTALDSLFSKRIKRSLSLKMRSNQTQSSQL